NIDIVFSELDALANIDLKTGEVKENLRELKFVRLGTSGALHKDISVDSFVLSSYGLGFDGLLHFYEDSLLVRDLEMEEAFYEHSNWDDAKAVPYFVKGSTELLERLSSEQTQSGITATALGFYGPQGRHLRLVPNPSDINEILAGFEYNGHRITNLDRKSTRLNSSHVKISYAVFCLKKKIMGRSPCNYNC